MATVKTSKERCKQRRCLNMADNSRAVNRVFTRKVICDLIENGRSDVFDYVVKRYIDDPWNTCQLSSSLSL